jgi:hypothetical protein
MLRNRAQIGSGHRLSKPTPQLAKVRAGLQTDCQFGWNLGESGGDHVSNGLLQRLNLASLQTFLVTFHPAFLMALLTAPLESFLQGETFKAGDKGHDLLWL